MRENSQLCCIAKISVIQLNCSSVAINYSINYLQDMIHIQSTTGLYLKYNNDLHDCDIKLS